MQPLPAAVDRMSHGAGGRLAGAPVERATVANKLLLALDSRDFARIAPLLRRVPLRPRQVLVEPHIAIREAFFIENGTASVVSRTRQDRGLEVSMIGCMGLAGLPLVLGSDTSPFRCVIQIGGTALRIEADDLRRAIDDVPALGRILMYYVHAHMIQQAQITVCNARHRVNQRVARWLLMGLDRFQGDALPVTHDLIGRMLGVRRAGVSLVVQGLEADGIVRAGRGRLHVIDRARLEASACGCYAFIRREYDRLVCCPDAADRRRQPLAAA